MATPGTVAGYQFEVDPQTKVPMHYLNFLLRHFLPLDVLADYHQYTQLETENSIRSSEWLDGFFNIKPARGIYTKKETKLPTGSIAEKLAVPDYNEDGIYYTRDRDVMECTSNIYELCGDIPLEYEPIRTGQMFVIEELDSPTDKHFAKLRVTDEYRKANELAGTPIPTDKKHLSSEGMVDSKLKSYSKHIPNDPGRLSVAGPAVNIADKMFIQPEDSGGHDLVTSFTFNYWPKIADDFLTRHRPSGWPSIELVHKIRDAGFHMVAVGRKYSDEKDLEWRYSFSLAEKMLALSLTDVQRKAYVYWKMLHSKYLKSEVFPTYFLKTLFFWCCEKLPISCFDDRNLGPILFHFLDVMADALIKGEVPLFCVPQVNIMARAPLEERRVHADLVHKIKHDLLNKFFAMTNRTFICLARLDFDLLCPKLAEYATMMPDDQPVFVNFVHKSLHSLLKEYFNRIRYAVNQSNALNEQRSQPNYDKTLHILTTGLMNRLCKTAIDIALELKEVETIQGTLFEFIVVKLGGLTAKPDDCARVFHRMFHVMKYMDGQIKQGTANASMTSKVEHGNGMSHTEPESVTVQVIETLSTQDVGNMLTKVTEIHAFLMSLGNEIPNDLDNTTLYEENYRVESADNWNMAFGVLGLK